MTSPSTPAAPVPVVLSGALAGVMGQGSANPHDILIEGIPFLVDPSQEDPYVRDLADPQKDQFDASGEAGENSFGDWWLRSQSSFHGGAGQGFLDSSQSDLSRQRFDESTRAYVHTPGEVVPDSGVSVEPVIAGKQVEQVLWSTVPKLAVMSVTTNQVTFYNLPDMSGATAVTVGAGGTIPAAMTSDGANVYVLTDDKVYKIAPAGVVTQLYHTLTFTAPVNIGYAKDRLIATVGPRVYELLTAPVGAPIAAPAAHYTNPASDYRYTSISDGPNGVYLAGYSGQRSDLSQMTVSESAGTLVLGQPTVQLVTPPAELINACYFYINSFAVLATTSGARVASFTPYGQLQLGPLSIDNVACYSVGAARELVWVGAVDSVWRIDLSTPVDDAGRYAAARKVHGFAPNVAVSDITVYPAVTQPLVFGTLADNKVIRETTFNPNWFGSVTTSWIRFGTVEPKQLHYVRVDGVFPAGLAQNPVSVKVENENGQSVTFNGSGGQSSYEFTTASLPISQLFRLTITIYGPDTKLTGYQLKALPTPKRYGEFILPLRCHDSETGKDGRRMGYKGFAKDRLQALEALAESGAKITVVDKLSGDTYRAVVRRLQFRQDTKPTRMNDLGGLVSIILRRV